MNVNLPKLKVLAQAAQSTPYDAVAGHDYGMSMPPAVALELIAEIERHRLMNAEGCKPEINIHPNGSTTTVATAILGLDKAEGEQPDLNFHLLQLAERSCSLLEDWVQTTNVQDGDLNDQIKDTRALLESQHPTWSIAVRDLLAERRRQVHEEGYPPGCDDRHADGELADAAAAYAYWAKLMHLPRMTSHPPPATWPWAPSHWKPTNQRKMLVKAGALILAELERLDRLEAREVCHD